MNKKILLFMFVFVLGLMSVNAYNITLRDDYNIAEINYSTSLNVGGLHTAQALSFNNNGTKLFICGESPTYIYEYTLSIPYSVNSSIYSQSFNFSSVPSVATVVGCEDILFNNNGSKMYVLSNTVGTDFIFELNLSVPYNISSSVYNTFFNLTPYTTLPASMSFNNNGTKIYILSNTNIKEFNLTTPYNINSMVYSTNISVSAPAGYGGISFDGDGSRLFYSDASRYIIENNLSVNYNIISYNYSRTSNIAIGSPSFNSLKFNNDGTKLYCVITTQEAIYEYNLTPKLSLNYSFSAPGGVFGETSDIILNLSKGNNQSYSNTKLIYNGTVYSSPTQTEYTNYTLFTQTINNNALGTFNYTWNVSLTDYGNVFNFTTVQGNHTVNGLTANLTFYDASTNTVMNAKNVSFKIIGAIQNNYSTTTGNYNLTNLSSGTYTIISNSQGYLQNSYIFSVSSSTNNPNINIYLTPNSTQTYYIVFTIIEKLSRQPIQGAIVTIQHYIDNAWATEQIYTTDFNGRGQGYFILNTDYYNFVITYNGVVYSGVLNNDANKKIMFYQDYLDGLGIEISLSQTNYINTLQGIDSAQTGLRYQNLTNNSGNFIYNFLDTLGQSRNWTLMVYQGNNLNCSTSVYSSSGNLACLITNNGSEQWFQAYTFIDGIPDKTINQRIGVNDAWDFDWGIGGWIFTIFVVIIAFTSFAQVPSISIMIGSAFFALALFFNVIFTRSANVSQLGIVIVFIAFLLAKIPSNSGVNS